MLDKVRLFGVGARPRFCSLTSSCRRKFQFLLPTSFREARVARRCLPPRLIRAGTASMFGLKTPEARNVYAGKSSTTFSHARAGMHTLKVYWTYPEMQHLWAKLRSSALCTRAVGLLCTCGRVLGSFLDGRIIEMRPTATGNSILVTRHSPNCIKRVDFVYHKKMKRGVIVLE